MSYETARQMEINVSDGKSGQAATAAGNIATTTITAYFNQPLLAAAA